MDNDFQPKRTPKRLSLSKKQLEEGAAVELVALLEDITADGKVTLQEAEQLRKWINGAAGLDFPGVEYLRQILEHVLEDGVLTSEEHKVLYGAIEKVLPPEMRQQAKEPLTCSPILHQPILNNSAFRLIP